MIPASKTRPMKKEIRAYETKNNYQNSQLHNRLMLSSERVSQTPGSKVASYNKISLLKNTTISSTDRLSSTNLGSSNILQSSSRQNSSIRKSQQYPPQRSIMQSTIANETNSVRPGVAMSPTRSLFNTAAKAPTSGTALSQSMTTSVNQNNR